MDILTKLTDIASRIDHLESQAEWIVKETVNTDSAISQTATLITALADNLREKICDLVKDMERGLELEKLH